MAFLDSIKHNLDSGLGIVAKKGLSPYQVWLTSIVNAQIDFDSTESNGTRTDTRITVSTGYASWIKPDGYMNPSVGQYRNKQLVMSPAQLTTDEIWVGPIVQPYLTQAGFSGGTDPTIFQPSVGSNQNQTLYLFIKGPSLAPEGNYFVIDRISVGPMHGMNYYIVLQGTAQQVSV